MGANPRSGVRSILLLVPMAAGLAVLSHVPALSKSAPVWILLLGVLPLAIGVRSAGLPSRKRDGDGPFPSWLTLSLAAVFLAGRIHGIGNLRYWPFTDESIHAGRAAALADGHRAQWVFGWEAREPLHTWLNALWFRVGGVSWTAGEWFFVAVSVLTVFLAWWSVRPLGRGSVPVLFAAFFAFSFWHLHMSFFGDAYPLGLLWMMLVLGTFLRWREKQGRPGNGRRWACMAVAAGTGFYTAPVWPAVMAMVLVGVAAAARGRRWAVVLGTGGVAALMASPLLWERLTSRGLHYYRSLFSLKELAGRAGEYLDLVFTGLGGTAAPYGPAWGGLLDPLSGARALLGAAAWLAQATPGRRWLAGILVLLGAVPFLAAHGIESHRAAVLLIPASFAMTWGARRLASETAPASRPFLWAVLTWTAAVLNLYHFHGPYQEIPLGSEQRRGFRSVEAPRAYDLVRRAAPRLGPLAVLSDLHVEGEDRSFALAVRPLDASRSGEDYRAAAFLCHAAYGEALRARFPDMEWTWLNPGTDPYVSSLALAILPVTPERRERVREWVRADRVFEEAALRGLLMPPGESHGRIAGELELAASRMGKDPFLVSVAWERVFQLRVLDGDAQGAWRALEKAITEGIPATHLLAWKRGLEGLLRGGAAQEARMAPESAKPATR